MNAAMNVTSGLLFGDIYSFDDKEFKQLAAMIKRTFVEFKSNQIARAIIYILPKPIITSNIGRALLNYLLPTLPNMGENVYRGFYPFLLKKIHDHQKSLDRQNPRDFLDFLLIESESNERIGWFSMIFSCMALYIGGSDTIAQTMRWTLVCLAQNQADQDKARVEIYSAQQAGKSIDQHSCPYFYATLLESQRRYPSGETVLHRTDEEIEYRGYVIPKGTFIRGIPLGVMHDPANFESPLEFRPGRFIDQSGRYTFDPKVCNFSVGLRQCPGMTIARRVLAELTSKLLANFRVTLPEGPVKIESSDGGMMVPAKPEIKWESLQ